MVAVLVTVRDTPAEREFLKAHGVGTFETRRCPLCQLDILVTEPDQKAEQEAQDPVLFICLPCAQYYVPNYKVNDWVTDGGPKPPPGLPLREIVTHENEEM